MKITYAIWQGSRLLSVGNEATSLKDVDSIIKELNNSDVASKIKFHANIQEVKVGK